MTLLWCIGVQAQEVITLNGDITEDLTPGESYLFYDSGGPTGDYGASQTYTAVLTNAGGSITINFSALATESSSSCYNWDYMLIYDDEELIGRAQTGCASATITTGQDYVAQSGTLKIEWHSDGSSFAAGWEATITAEGGGGPTCDKPESCDITDITTNGATVNFAGGSGTYNVEIKGGAYADWTFAIKNTNLTYYTLSDLAPNTNYSVRVTSVCGDNTSGSKSASFKTLIGLPFGENFNGSSAPDGWSVKSGKLNADGSATLSSGSGWSYTTGNGVFDKHAKAEIYSTNCYKWLILPEILIPTMEEGDLGYQLTFNVALTAYSGTLQPATKGAQNDDRFIVLASLDGGANWNILQEWNNAGSAYVYDDIACSAGGEEVSIDISAYAGQSIILAFYGESTSGPYSGAGDNYLHIDDVLVDRIPTCLKPTDLHEVEGMTTKNLIGAFNTK